jgi:hypothetical protein
MELVAPQETSDHEINIIVYYLQRSPHSFQWFRDNTEVQYTNEQFSALVAKHSKIIEPITIVSSDEEKRKNAGYAVDKSIQTEDREGGTEPLTEPGILSQRKKPRG